MRFAHERAKARDEGRDLFRGGLRAFQQRPLHDAPGRRFHAHDHAVDGRGGRMRFQIQQDQRAQRFRIAHGRGQLQRARVGVASGEVQFGVQHRGAAVGAFESHRKRFQHAPQDERKWLQTFDGPFELERGVEGLVVDERHERRQVVATRGVLPARTERPQARRQFGRRQIGEHPQRADAPAAQHIERLIGAQACGVVGAAAAAAHLHLAAHPAAGLWALMRIARMRPSRGGVAGRGARRAGGRAVAISVPIPGGKRRHRQHRQRRAGRGRCGRNADAWPPQRQQRRGGVRGRHCQTHDTGINQRAPEVIGNIAGTAKQAFHPSEVAQHEPAHHLDPRGKRLCHPHQRVDRRGHRIERGKHRVSAPPRGDRHVARRPEARGRLPAGATRPPALRTAVRRTVWRGDLRPSTPHACSHPLE